MRILLPVLIVMFFTSSACYAKIELKISEKNPTVLRVADKKVSKSIPLNITISDFKISCDRRSAVVWGQTTKKLGVGEVPYARIYIINLQPIRILNSYTVSRGPYEVRFLCHRNQVLIDEYLIDSKTGTILNTNVTDTQSLEFESCGN